MPPDHELISFVVTLPDTASEELDRLKAYIRQHGSVRRAFKLTNTLSAQLPNSLFDDLKVNFPSARIDMDDPGELEQFGR